MTPSNKTMDLIELIRELNSELKETKEIQTAVAKIANAGGQKLDILTAKLEDINQLAQVLKENNKYIMHVNPTVDEEYSEKHHTLGSDTENIYPLQDPEEHAKGETNE